jgi:hypothetical protein
MWTPAIRRQHSRNPLRYGSDLADAEWEIIASFMPVVRRRLRSTAGSCASAAKDYSRRSTIIWSRAIANGSGGRRARVSRNSRQPSLDKLGMRASRRPSPAALAATMRARRSRAASGTPWSTQMGERCWSRSTWLTFRIATAPFRCSKTRESLPVHQARLRQRLRRPTGQGLHLDRHRGRQATRRPSWLRRPATTKGRRALFAWINRNRRLVKDFEGTVASAETFLYAASSCCSRDDRGHLTQVGRALEQLGVEHIGAYSPRASRRGAPAGQAHHSSGQRKGQDGRSENWRISMAILSPTLPSASTRKISND